MNSGKDIDKGSSKKERSGFKKGAVHVSADSLQLTSNPFGPKRLERGENKKRPETVRRLSTHEELGNE